MVNETHTVTCHLAMGFEFCVLFSQSRHQSMYLCASSFASTILISPSLYLREGPWIVECPVFSFKCSGKLGDNSGFPNFTSGNPNRAWDPAVASKWQDVRAARYYPGTGKSTWNAYYCSCDERINKLTPGRFPETILRTLHTGVRATLPFGRSAFVCTGPKLAFRRKPL